MSDTRARVQRICHGSVTARRPAVLMLGTALCLAGCTSQHKAEAKHLAPPTIKESFTPLDCPSSPARRGTTLGAEGCLELRILETDALLNRHTKAFFGFLRDRSAKAKFVAAERVWRAYREKACASVADVYRGGTAEPVAFVACKVARNQVHLREVAAFELSLHRQG